MGENNGTNGNRRVTELLVTMLVPLLSLAIAFGVLSANVERNRLQVERIENRTDVLLDRLEDKIDAMNTMLTDHVARP